MNHGIIGRRGGSLDCNVGGLYSKYRLPPSLVFLTEGAWDGDVATLENNLHLETQIQGIQVAVGRHSMGEVVVCTRYLLYLGVLPDHEYYSCTLNV